MTSRTHSVSSLPHPHYWWIGCFCLFTFLCFFRPESAWRVPPVWDDHCYLEWLYEALGTRVPMCPAYRYFGHNYYFPGAPLTWLPAAWLGKTMAELTQSNLELWVSAAVGLNGFLFWSLGLFMLAQVAAARGVTEKSLTPLYVLCAPVLYYAVARPFMSHSSEFFLASATLWALHRRLHLLASLLALWLCGTRLNDSPILLLLLGYWIDLWRSQSLAKRERNTLYFLFTVAALAGLWVMKFILVDGYAQLGPQKLLGVFYGLSFAELGRFLFGKFGMLWTGFLWLSLWALGGWYWRSLSWMSRAGWLWMTVLLLVCVGWKSHGGDAFAYRYLIGTYTAAFVILLEIRERAPTSLVIRYLLPAQAFVVTTLTWVYNTRFNFTWDNLASWPSHFLASIQLLGISILGTSLNFFANSLGIELPHQPRLLTEELILTALCSLVALTGLIWAIQRVFSSSPTKEFS